MKRYFKAVYVWDCNRGAWSYYATAESESELGRIVKAIKRKDPRTAWIVKA